MDLDLATLLASSAPLAVSLPLVLDLPPLAATSGAVAASLPLDLDLVPPSSATCPLASTMAGMVLLAVTLLATGASFNGITTTLPAGDSPFLPLLPIFMSPTLSLPGGDGAMVLLSL